MKPRLRPLPFALALLAWFLQLWLPAAHALAMSPGPDGAARAWCGSTPPDPQILAALPAEIRDRLAPSTGATAGYLPDCTACCALWSTTVLPARSPGLPGCRGGQASVRAPTPAPATAASGNRPPPARAPPSASLTCLS